MPNNRNAENIEKLQSDVGSLKVDVAVVKSNMKTMSSDLKELSKTINDNIGGIKLANVLNSKLVATVAMGLLAGGLFFAAKTGGLGS
jgi:hypothetical protein